MMWPTLNQITALVSVVLIDVMLAGDNAIVVGMAAAGLPPERRRRAIVIGIGAATVLRILFAAVALQLLAIIGLALAGGLLLLWVAWKMFRQLRQAHPAGSAEGGGGHAAAPHTTVRQAVINIVAADISMSLDNVLAVAGAAQKHLGALIFGLILSVALMGFASAFIANLLDRHRWIAYLGLAIIFVVALRMVYNGLDDVTGGNLIPDIPHVSEHV